MNTSIRTIILAALSVFAASTPFASVRAQDINLTGYTLTFDDEFTTLSVTTSNPKGSTNWFAGPANGSTGDFSESNWNINSFSVSSGTLTDEAWYSSTQIGGYNWQSGELTSIDPSKTGFSQQYGYFEIRCEMPNAGEGAWPAFWLLGTAAVGNTEQNEEVDVFEWYGNNNTPGSDKDYIQQASHNWNTNGTQNDSLPYLLDPTTSMPDGEYPWQGVHIYGCQIDPVHITWYIDGTQTNQIATPTSYLTTPFYVMVDYALGGGWPLSGSPFTTDGTSSLLVDWVRVYALPSSGTSSMIGANFYNSTDETATLTSTNVVGAGTASLAGWNNPLNVSSTKPTNVALKDNTDTTTTATLSVNPSGTAADGLPTTYNASNNTSLYGTASGEGTWSGTFSSTQVMFNGNLASSGNTGYATELSLTNIPYSSYSIYVYTWADYNRSASVQLYTGSTAGPIYYLANGPAWYPTLPTTYTQATGTSAATYTSGANYAVFTGLSGSSQKIDIASDPVSGYGLNSNNGSPYISAIQIVSNSAPPPIIGANFYNSTDETATVTSTNVVGAGAGSSAGWNNPLNVSSTKPTNVALKDSTGTTTTATFSVNPNGTAADGLPTTYNASNNTSLYGTASGEGTWSGTFSSTQVMFNGNLASSGNTGYATELSLTNIPYSNYAVYVYVWADYNRSASAQVYTGSTAGPIYYLANGPAWYPALPTSYVQATGTSAATYTSGANYVMFTGLSGSSQKIDIASDPVSGYGLNTNDGSPYISGFEIVPQ